MKRLWAEKKEILIQMATDPLWFRPSKPNKYVPEAELPLRLRFVRWLGHRRWMPRGQDRLLRLLLSPDPRPHFYFDVDFFGQRYRGDLAHYIDWLVFCYGSASMAELSLLRECVKAVRSNNSGPVLFLDVGANVGHHTTFMAGIADQVIAFEPYPPLLEQIREKVALNKLENVMLVPFGLGEKDEVLDYYPGAGGNSGVGTFLPDEELRAAPTKLQIKQGDSILEQLGAGRIDILKVDVEGFEAAVFRGLYHRIQRDQPIILTELGVESRRQFGSEQAFREAFYPGAHFSAVSGRHGHKFELRRFEYVTSQEVLITPSDMGWLRKALLESS
jgi:FkbM family methyltransferase